MLASSAVASARARRVYRFFEIVADQLGATDFAETIAPFLFGRTFHNERPAIVDDIIRATRPTAAARTMMIAQARALRAFDGRAAAARVRAPTLCVAGLEDTLTGPDEVRATAALFERAVYHEVPDAGHTLLLESARVFEMVCGFCGAGHGATA
jgi:pimeloyl-ACP methyl ester carboxylesterase